MTQWLYVYEDNEDSSNGTILHFEEGDRVRLATAEQVATFPIHIQDWYKHNVPNELLGSTTFISRKCASSMHSDGYYRLDCFEDGGIFYDQDLALLPGGPPKPLGAEAVLPEC